MTFNITTTAYERGAKIPVKYTCQGDNTSPPLRWEYPPKNTTSFALIMEDPDAPGGTFTHWIVYNLPPDCRELEIAAPMEKNLENGAIQGKNDFGKTGYGGPCPPKGELHRYIIRVFALNKKLPPESANKSDGFYSTIEDHILDEASYMGVYKLQNI
jgi:Raf kinase inhibitor-like YbhB/YbcL family protein